MVNRKHLSQNVAFGLFRLLSLSVVGILFAILGFIIYKGIGVIDWEFLTTAPTNGMTAGGILPAIVGTFCLMAGSALFAFPVGVMSGIYMNEYVPKGWVVRFIRMMTNNLSGIPSIVFGLFGMALFVNYMDFGDSILAGSLTLGLLSLPLVIRTTEEALKAIPLPSMMLQTLVENAIKHGLEPKSGGGTVWIIARQVDDALAVTVADDGQGFNVQSSGTGIGLKNVRERLRLAYGNAASFNIVANFPNGVAATINVPVAGPGEA